MDKYQSIPLYIKNKYLIYIHIGYLSVIIIPRFIHIYLYSYVCINACVIVYL